MKKIIIAPYEEVQKNLDKASKKTVEFLEKLKNNALICKCCFEEKAEVGFKLCKSCREGLEAEESLNIEDIDKLLKSMD
jgi:hypothetical protein